MTPDESDAIIRLEELRARALVDCDIAALHALIDQAYHHVDWNGAIRTRSEFLDDLSDGRIAYDLFVIVENHITLSDMSAVAAGTYFSVVREDGRRPAPKYLRHLRVYHRIADGWSLLAHQATAAPLRL